MIDSSTKIMANSLVFFRTIKATYFKNRKTIKRAYPWGFVVGRIIDAFSNLLFPLFIFFFVALGETSSLFDANNTGLNYISYVTFGSALYVVAVSTLMNVGRSLITEMREGTISVLLVSTAPRLGYLIGCYVEQLARALMEFTIIMASGFILGARFSLGSIFPLFLVVLFTTICCFCMSVFLGSLMLYLRDTVFVQNTLFYLMAFLCGIVFPVSYLPVFLQAVSYIIPLTHALEIFRLIGGDETPAILTYLAAIGLSITYLIAGMFWLKKLEPKLCDEVFI